MSDQGTKLQKCCESCGTSPEMQPGGIAEGAGGAAHGERADRRAMERWFLPLGILALLLSLTFFVWWHQRRGMRRDVQSQVASIANQLCRRLEESVDDYFRPMRRLGRDVVAGRMITNADLLKTFDSLHSVETFRAFRRMGWVGADDVGRLAAPADEGAALLGTSLIASEDWAAALRAGKLTFEPTVAHAEPGPVLDFLVPAHLPASPGDYGGAMVARVDLSAPFDQIIGSRIEEQFQVELYDGATRVFQNGHSSPTGDLPEVPWQTMMGDRAWVLKLKPTTAFLATAYSRWILWWIPLMGTLAAIFVSSSVWLVMDRRWREINKTRRLVDALESLQLIFTRINARLGSSGDVLQQLVEAARRMLDMDYSNISVLEEDGKRVRILAFSGVESQGRLEFSIDEMPMISMQLQSREICFVEDVSRSRLPMNRPLLNFVGVQAFVSIPLCVEGAVVGFLRLHSKRPRAFSEAQVKLSRLLGTQAAVTLANNALYRQRGQALELQQQRAEHRQALINANIAIAKSSSLEQSLRKIVEVVPELLGVDLGVLTLSGENTPEETVIAAVTPPYAAYLTGMRISRRGTYAMDMVRTKKAHVVEDAMADPTVHEEMKRILRIGSLASLPLLQVGGGYMGALTLIRHKPGPFKKEELELAEVFGAAVGATVENVLLLEQARRDADTKAMLLRELNHRVKNSLARIVAFLTIDQPAMHADAQQWLDRARERIGNMARAHDLFSGGISEVGIESLVSQLLPSLQLVKPPGARIDTEFEEIDVKLDAPRAVSLGMVLYELCYNALVHGVGANGRVLVRARRDEQMIAVEVIDDGSRTRESRQTLFGAEPVREDAGRDGLGLKLVAGLVSRELRGTFLQQAGDSGCIAIVKFPINVSPGHGGKS